MFGKSGEYKELILSKLYFHCDLEFALYSIAVESVSLYLYLLELCCTGFRLFNAQLEFE